MTNSVEALHGLSDVVEARAQLLTQANAEQAVGAAIAIGQAQADTLENGVTDFAWDDMRVVALDAWFYLVLMPLERFLELVDNEAKANIPSMMRAKERFLHVVEARWVIVQDQTLEQRRMAENGEPERLGVFPKGFGDGAKRRLETLSGEDDPKNFGGTYL